MNSVAFQNNLPNHEKMAAATCCLCLDAELQRKRERLIARNVLPSRQHRRHSLGVRGVDDSPHISFFKVSTRPLVDVPHSRLSNMQSLPPQKDWKISTPDSPDSRTEAVRVVVGICCPPLAACAITKVPLSLDKLSLGMCSQDVTLANLIMN